MLQNVYFLENLPTFIRAFRKNIGKNSYIGRYSKAHISADNIGRPIYRSTDIIGRYSNFHRYLGVLVDSTAFTTFILIM